jgi:hypothetical protein
MRKGELFRLTRGAVAIAQRDSRNAAILVPEGAIIEVLGGPFDGVRLMDVRYNGELIMMFTNDMETHTQKITRDESGAPTIVVVPASKPSRKPSRIRQGRDFAKPRT